MNQILRECLSSINKKFIIVQDECELLLGCLSYLGGKREENLIWDIYDRLKKLCELSLNH